MPSTTGSVLLNLEFPDRGAYTGFNYDEQIELDRIDKDTRTRIDQWAQQVTASLDTLEISINQALTGTFSPGRTILVAKSGVPETSISGGLVSASLLNPAPSIENPAAVLVYPGTYIEQPLSLTANVRLASAVGPAATIISASDGNSVISAASNTEINGFTLKGNGDNTPSCFRMVVDGLTTVRNCIIRNSVNGIEIIGTGSEADILVTRMQNVAGTSDTMTNAFVAASGALCTLATFLVKGQSGNNISKGIRVSDAGTNVRLLGGIFERCDDGIFIDDDGRVASPGGLEIALCTNAIHMSSSGDLEFFSTNASGSTTYDLLIDNKACKLRGAANVFRDDIISIPSGSNVVQAFVSDRVGDEGFNIHGELHVGTHLDGKESAFGGGDSHTNGMRVFLNTSGSSATWSNFTTQAASATGSSFDMFPSGGLYNQTFHVGGDVAFPGLQVSGSTAMVLNTGSIVWEYVSASEGTWQSFNVMATDADYPYNQYGNAVLQRANFREQIRFASMPGWITSSLNGQSKYWVRCRTLDHIETVPSIEQVKVHTNRTEINADGFQEYFGISRPERRLEFHRRLNDSIVGALPGNQNLDISANIELIVTANQFGNNAEDSKGGTIVISKGLDTSRSVILDVYWYPEVTGGNVELEVQYAALAVGDLIDGSATEAALATVLAAPAIGTLTKTSFELDIPTLVDGEFLAVRYFRDATAANTDDTLVGNIVIFATELRGTFWH